LCKASSRDGVAHSAAAITAFKIARGGREPVQSGFNLLFGAAYYPFDQMRS
jgi:hypothetical protein